MTRRALPWSLILLVACIDPPARDPQPLQAMLPVQIGPFDALAQRFGRLRQRVEQRGYAAYAGPARLFVVEGEGVALPVDLATEHCTTFVALAGGNLRDLEVALFDGEGSVVSSDDTLGEAGLLHVCPQPGPRARRHAPHYLTIQALTGSGAVILEAYRPSRLQPDGFDSLFEGFVAPLIPVREVEGRLAKARASLGSRGWLPSSTPILGRLAEGDVFRQVAELEGGACYAAAVRAAPGLVDIAVFLFDPTGAEVARDLGGAPDATLEHCAKTTGRYTLEVRGFEGAGGVGLQWMKDSSPRHDPPVEPVAEDATRELTQEPTREDAAVRALEALSAALLPRGYAPAQFVAREGYLTHGEVARHEVLLQEGCSIIAAATGHDALDIDLYLTTLDGDLLDRDTGVETGARVGTCTTSPSMLRIVAKAYGQDGTYALAVFPAPPTIGNLQSLRLEQASAAFSARGYQESWRRQDRLEAGQTLTRHTVMPAGTCIAWVAAGGPGVRDVDLVVRDEDDQLLVAETGAAPYAAANRCAQDAQRVTTSASVFDGSGEVVLTQWMDSD